MPDILSAALDLADRGIPVFPIGQNKRPTTEHGHLDASLDPQTIARLFANPLAAHIGIPTGDASGLAVVDLDPRNGSEEWMREHGDAIPQTRTHRTRSGGHHLLFQQPPGLRCSAGKVAPGVDIRADGGYIVWWPATDGAVERDLDPQPLPAWIAEAATAHKANKPQLDGPAVAPPPREAVSDDMLLSILEGIELRLGAAEEGGKHAALCRESVLLGGILYATEWNEDEAAEWLVERLPDTVADHELAIRTALSGIEKGARHPVTIGAEAEFGAVPLPPEPPHADLSAVRRSLSAAGWLERDIPEPDRLLGDVLTTTTRMFLVGKTGLGKTMLGLAMAAGIAGGAPVLHWPAGRPARVLYIDGEMPAELIKPRTRDTLRRLGPAAALAANNLFIFGRDIEDEVRSASNAIPGFEPLNTEAGQNFILALIQAIGGVDLVVFDNVMSLLSGDQKEEQTWAEAQRLVMQLTAKRIGQLWLDHTGHNTERQYGSSTKSWRFDTVAVMKAIEGVPDPAATAFTLSFDKTRRRTPDNWQQFAASVVRLADDVWTSTPAAPAEAPRETDKPPSPDALRRYELLTTLLARTGRDSATVPEWYAECCNAGIDDLPPKGATSAQRDKATASFRARRSELVKKRWIQINGAAVMDLHGLAPLE